MADRTTELARCPLFGSVSADELAEISQASRALSVRAGDPIFREGMTCEGFYIVAVGSVRVYKVGPDGRERILHVVRPPHAFGEAAMFGKGVYPAFAAALEDSRLILVRREPFVRMLRDRPETALGVLESFSMWMHRLLDQLENETFLNARAKVANYLLREARHLPATRAPLRIDLAHAKKDIASHLGMAPETFSRALSDLAARGLIATQTRCIDLLDAEAMEALLLGECPDK